MSLAFVSLAFAKTNEVQLLWNARETASEVLMYKLSESYCCEDLVEHHVLDLQSTGCRTCIALPTSELTINLFA